MSAEMDQVAAVVLAGGFGTRVRHLLPDVPKPMAPVAGKPFLEWVLRYLVQQGIRRAVLSTGFLAEVVERHFLNHPVGGLEVKCVPETDPLGTAGGFLNAAQAVQDPPKFWVILNGDSLVFADLVAAVKSLADPAWSGVILGRAVPDAARYGTLVAGPRGELLRFEEKRPGAGVINSGIYLLRHALLEKFPAVRPLSFEQEVFPVLIRGGAKIKIVETDAPFLDIGTPESLPQAEQFIRENARHFSDH